MCEDTLQIARIQETKYHASLRYCSGAEHHLINGRLL